MDDLTARRRRAAYRAQHRGTKEMDFLVGRFCEAYLETMNDPRLMRFEQLLALPDPLLQSWILESGMIADENFAALVADIRHFHGLADTKTEKI